jgi:hypothetical protein
MMMMMLLMVMLMMLIHGHYYCGARDPSLMMLKLEMKRRRRV